MNILITDFYGGPAGSTMSAFYLATGLAERGHTVHVACENGSLLHKLLNSKVHTLSLRINGKLDFTLAKKLKAYIVENGIEIVDVQASRDRYILAWATLFYKLEVTVLHTRRQAPRSSGGALHRWFYVKVSKKIVLVSEGLKQIFIKKGYPENHLYVIHNGIPQSRYENWTAEKVDFFRKKFDLGHNDIVIGSVSRLKEQVQILKAVKRLNNSDIKILFAGIEPGSLDPTIAELGITNQVIYTGFIDNSDILNIYRLLTVKILASTMDGFGLVLLESMAMGCPVIGTSFGGIKDVIEDGVNGFTFQNNNIEELADKIKRMLYDKNLREKFIQAGYKTAFEHYTIEKTIANREKLYASVQTSESRYRLNDSSSFKPVAGVPTLG